MPQADRFHFIWPELGSGRRLLRDAGLAGVLGLAAAFGVYRATDLSPSGVPAPAPIEGKLVDRLAFSAPEETPVRETRIFDSLAMFSIDLARPADWSRRLPPADLRIGTASGAAPAMARTLPEPNGGARMRVATADGAARPRAVAAVKPPVRPDLPQPVVTGSVVPATVSPRPATPPVPAREPIRVAGFDLPGTQYLPGRQDASDALNLIGSGAGTVGTVAMGAAGRGAGAVGSGIATAGRTIGDVLGLD